MSEKGAGTTRTSRWFGAAALAAALVPASLVAGAPALASAGAAGSRRARVTVRAQLRPLRGAHARLRPLNDGHARLRPLRGAHAQERSLRGARALALDDAIEVQTQEVRSSNATAAVVEGIVYGAPKGTTVQLYYAQASNPWCVSSGTLGDPPQKTAPRQLNAGEEEVQLEVGGLEQKVEYCVALVAEGGGSSGMGEQLSFVAGAPSVGEASAESLSATSAQISAEVDAAEQATEYRVLYGASESQWCESGGAGGAPDGASEGALSTQVASDEYLEVSVSGLSQGAEYCALLELENESGSARGEETWFTAGEPSVLLSEAYPDSPSVESLEGFVSPAGQTTSYYAEYAPAGSTWCETEEAAEGWPRESGASALAPGAEPQQQVQVEVDELTAGTRYCAELVAENETTASITHVPAATSPPFEFTAGVGAATELEAVPVSPTSATLYATLYPAAQPTSYEPVYAEAQSPTCTGEEQAPQLELRGLGPARGAPLASGGAPLASGGAPFASGGEPFALGGAPFTSGGVGPYRFGFELEALSPGHEYCAYLIASNGSGRMDAEEAREHEVYFVAGAPTARTSTVSAKQKTALVDGEVQTAGQETRYSVLYDAADSRWCETGGVEAGASERTEPEQTEPAQTLAAGDGSFAAVQVELTGLEDDSEYCAAIVAENGSGPSPPAPPAFFQTRPPASVPTASITRVLATTQSTAGVEGEVDPGYAQTGYWLQYGLASSQWCQTQGGEGSPEGETPHATLEAEDAEGHSVHVEVTGLSAGSEYCAALVAENEAGGASRAKPVRFTTASAESGSSGSHEGGQGVLGNKEEVKPGTTHPQVGTQAQVGAVSGTVRVQLKGTKRFVALTAGMLISDGSEIEALAGRVRVTVSLPNGSTQAAEVFGGRFRIAQEADGFTKFVLTLPLTGCARTQLPKGSASAASILRTQPLARRHLWVTEKGGKWGTNGRYVSTSVEGTTWNTTDECGRSIVFVREGRVKVRNLVTHRTKVLTAGHSYTASAARARKKHPDV